MLKQETDVSHAEDDRVLKINCLNLLGAIKDCTKNTVEFHSKNYSKELKSVPGTIYFLTSTVTFFKPLYERSNYRSSGTTRVEYLSIKYLSSYSSGNIVSLHSEFDFVSCICKAMYRIKSTSASSLTDGA